MIALITALLQLVNLFMEYAKERRIIDAAQQKQLKEAVDATNRLFGEMEAARAAAYAKHDSGVSDHDDPYRRD